MRLNDLKSRKRIVHTLLALLFAVSWSSCSAVRAVDDTVATTQESFPSSVKLQRATIPRAPKFPNVSAITRPGKGGDYLSEIQADGFYCWPVAKLPIKVYFQSAKNVPGYKNKFADCLTSCFDEWSEASGGKIAWVRVYDPSLANISVRWTSAVTERAEGTEAGRTKTFASLNTVTNRGTIHGAEMLLLTRLPEREFTADQVRRAYLHEVGHAFGIAGHSHNPNDIMYYAVTEHASPHLDDRDKATIVNLYNG